MRGRRGSVIPTKLRAFVGDGKGARQGGGGPGQAFQGAFRRPSPVDGTTPGPRRGVPALGEHTAEVLAEAGLSPERIDALLESGTAEPVTEACEVPK